MAEKVKVKSYYNTRCYEEVEVEEKEAKAITLRNQLIWHVDNKKKYQYKQLEKDETNIYSLEQWQDDGSEVEGIFETNPEEIMIENEINAEIKLSIRQAINELVPSQKQLVYKFYYLGLTVSEIAKIKGVSKPAITQALKRVIDTLREKIKFPDDFWLKPLTNAEKFTLYSEGVEIGGVEQ